MYSLVFPWKQFKVHLPDIETWLKGNAGNIYLGNMADELNLTIFFKEKPSENIELRIQGFWEEMTEAGELQKIEIAKKSEKAEQFAQDNIIHTDLSKMIPAEKKIFMGLPLTREDREELLKKYPQD